MVETLLYPKHDPSNYLTKRKSHVPLCSMIRLPLCRPLPLPFPLPLVVDCTASSSRLTPPLVTAFGTRFARLSLATTTKRETAQHARLQASTRQLSATMKSFVLRLVVIAWGAFRNTFLFFKGLPGCGATCLSSKSACAAAPIKSFAIVRCC